MARIVPEEWRDVIDQDYTKLDLRWRFGGLDEEEWLDVGKITGFGSIPGVIGSGGAWFFNLASVPQIAAGMAVVLVVSFAVGFIWKKSKAEIPQNDLFVRVSGEEFIVLYDEELCFHTPYVFRYSDSGEQYTITGIACIPLSTGIQSPLAEVVGGGVGNRFAEISLKPQKKGRCGCRVVILAKIRQPPVQQRTDVIDLWQRNERNFRRIADNSLVLVIPGEEGNPVIYEENVCNSSSYTFRHSDEQYTITGIACVPFSQEIQSPKAEVIEGGLKESHVAIRLKPEEEGQYRCRITVCGKIRQPSRQQRCDALVLRNREEIPQCEFIEGCPEIGSVVHRKRVVRYLEGPLTIKYSHPTDIITGIACVRADTETQSPEAEVTEGGVNYNHVAIRLTPVQSGKWACHITIWGKPSAAIVDGQRVNSTNAAAAPTDSTSAASAPIDSTHASTPLAGSTRAAEAPAPSVPANAAVANPANLKN